MREESFPRKSTSGPLYTETKRKEESVALQGIPEAHTAADVELGAGEGI